MSDQTSARSLALAVLLDWQKDAVGLRRPISTVLELQLRNLSLSPQEKALLHELVYGVLRHKTWLDWRIDAFLSRKNLPIEIRTILETCAFQIDFLNRIPASAAVDEAVKLAKAKGHSWAAGLVNAVARRLAESKANPAMPDRFAHKFNMLSQLERYSILFSHPLWLLKRWEKRLGMKDMTELCCWNNEKAGLCLRVNPLKIGRDDAIDILKQAGFSSRIGKYSPQAIWLDDFFGNPAKLPGMAEGFFQVQDEAAQVVGFCLNPKPDDLILDFCAGLGGKTTHLAELTDDRAKIIAYDTNNTRLAKLTQNAARLGLKSINILTNYNQLKTMRFTKILLDAPCSGLGTLRRHPDIKWNRSEEFIEKSAKRQLMLLNQTSSLLMPGGLLCYVTCTTEPEETTDVLESFLKMKDGFEVIDIEDFLPENAKRFLHNDHFIRITPEHNGPDLFFMAVIRKRKTE